MCALLFEVSGKKKLEQAAIQKAARANRRRQAVARTWLS